MRATTIGSKVKVVFDGKTHDGEIVEVITQGGARIEIGENKHVLADYSLSGADGTFHYPDEQIVKPTTKPKHATPPPTKTAATA